MDSTTEMSEAARAAVEQAQIKPVLGMGGADPRWMRVLEVAYRLDESGWRPARDGERCHSGAGGRGRREPACGMPAVVAIESMRGTKPYTVGKCELHSGGRIPLRDGRVIVPVSNPLGGA